MKRNGIAKSRDDWQGSAAATTGGLMHGEPTEWQGAL